MPGAGSATLAFGLEDTFLGSVTDPDNTGTADYYSFGRNPTVSTLSLDNQLQRMREAGKIENVEAVKGNFEGAVTVEAVANEATFDRVNEVVFNNAGSGFTTGRAQSAQVLAGVEHLASGGGTNTKIRALKGAIPTDFEVSYQQGDMVRFTLTMLYADEADGASPSELTRPAGGQDAAFHNVDVSVDSTTVDKLQSATLSFSNLYRFQRDADPTPVAAVLAQPEGELQTEAVYGDATYLERAYGSGGATTPQDRLTGVSGTYDITISGTTVATYGLQSLKPTTYDWSSLLDGETDTTDPVTWLHSGQVAVST